MKNRVMLLAGILIVLLSGCATAPMASIERDRQAKMFVVKSELSNIYVYRNESFGGAVKIDVELDGKPVGYTVAKSYLMLEVPPGKHTLISKAENDSVLDMITEAGKANFVWQEVKMGVWYARNKLQLVDETIGKAGVAECKLIESAQQVFAPVLTNMNPETPTQINESTSQKLRELQALVKDGLITEDEFQTKKKQLLEKQRGDTH